MSCLSGKFILVAVDILHRSGKLECFIDLKFEGSVQNDR